MEADVRLTTALLAIVRLTMTVLLVLEYSTVFPGANVRLTTLLAVLLAVVGSTV
jgi:hypothetical protein